MSYLCLQRYNKFFKQLQRTHRIRIKLMTSVSSVVYSSFSHTCGALYSKMTFFHNHVIRYKKFLSFPPPKCFPTFAVWKHFSIYPYPRTGSPYLTANSSFSSPSSPKIGRWKKTSLSAFSNGQGLLSFAGLAAKSS